MAIRSGFHRSVGNDRVYDAKFFADYFASFIGNGIFANPSTNLQVMAFQNMTTVVKPGKGWINGWILFNDSDYQLVHDGADGSLKRIDRIVLRLDHIAREITINIKKGTNASSPVAPTLTRGIDVYELALADVLISNGVTSISQANITDTRSNNALCGYVAGVVQQLDTTTIFNQMLAALQDNQQEYDDDFLTWSTDKRDEFDDWFQDIQDILDANVAGNLQNQIDDLDNFTQNSLSALDTAINNHTAANNTSAHTISNINGLTSALASKASDNIYTETIVVQDWTGNAANGYTATIMIPGILATDVPVIGPSYTGVKATDTAIRASWSMVYYADAQNGSIVFKTLGDLPTVDIDIIVKVVR